VKTRNVGYGWASWLGDEWVDGIARGEHATQAAARELAHEVATMRRARLDLIASMRTAAAMLCEKHGVGAADAVLIALRHIATPDEIWPLTDTPPSDAPVASPPRARSSG